MANLIGDYEKDRAKTVKEREELLAGLLECWTRTKDMRLGQLLVNAVSEHVLRHKSPQAADAEWRESMLFYMEDRVILAALQEYVSR